MSSPIFQCNSLKARYPGLNLDEVEGEQKIFTASTWINTSGLMPPADVLTVKFKAYQENQIGIKERLSVRYQLNLIFYLGLTRLGNIQLQISSKMFKYWLLTGNALMLEWLWCSHRKGHVLFHVFWLAQIFSNLMLTNLKFILVILSGRHGHRLLQQMSNYFSQTINSYSDLNECVKVIDMEKCSLFLSSEHCPS